MRREFPAKVKVAAFERAGGRCEDCTAIIRHGAHYDHRVPDALNGQPTLENCRLLCRTCHALKTNTEDIPKIAKSKRTRAKHVNAREKRPTFRKVPPGYDPWRRQWRQ